MTPSPAMSVAAATTLDPKRRMGGSVQMGSLLPFRTSQYFVVHCRSAPDVTWEYEVTSSADAIQTHTLSGDDPDPLLHVVVLTSV